MRITSSPSRPAPRTATVSVEEIGVRSKVRSDPHLYGMYQDLESRFGYYRKVSHISEEATFGSNPRRIFILTFLG